MFCSNCGTKVNDEAKFCFNCGNKIEGFKENNTYEEPVYEEEIYEEESIYEEPVYERESIYEEAEESVQGVVFPIADKVIVLHKNAKTTIWLKTLRDVGEGIARKFVEDFDVKFSNFEELYGYLSGTMISEYREQLDRTKKLIEQQGYRNFGAIYGREIGNITFKILNYIEGMKEAYEELIQDANNQAQAREMRKAYRRKYSGGSWTWDNALSNKMAAGSKNLASGVMHSLRNSAGNAMTKAEVNRKLNNIYKDSKEVVYNLIKEDMNNAVDIVFQLLNGPYNDEVLDELYSSEDKLQAIGYYAELGNLETDEERIESIYNQLLYCGECKRFYADALALFPRGIRGLRELAEFHLLNFDEIIEEAEERKRLIDTLTNLYGYKGYYLDQRLQGNEVFQKHKFNFYKDLNYQFKSIREGIEDGKFIYINNNEITRPNYDIAILALENYVYLEKEIPLFLYNYETSYKNVNGIFLTNKRLHFKDSENIIQTMDIEDITFYNIKHNEETGIISINNINTNIYIKDIETGKKLVDELTYHIVMINYLFSINPEYKFEDELQLENKFFNNYVSLKGYKKEEKDFLEVRLNKNSLYHKVKENFNGDVEHDINEVWKNYNYKKLWNLNLTDDLKVREKLNKALGSYGALIREKELILHDSTVFGGAKEGFIVTGKNIYFKDGMFGKPDSIDIRKDTSFKMDIETIIFQNGKELKISSLANEEKIEAKRTLEITIALMIANYSEEVSCQEEVACEKEEVEEIKAITNGENKIEDTAVVEIIKDVEIVKEKRNLGNDEIRNRCIELIENMLSDEGRKYVQHFNEIPKNKVYKINKNLKPLMIEEEILIGHDTSILGSFKSGYVFTTKGIHWKNMFEKQVSIGYHEIIDIELEKNTIKFNGMGMDLGFQTKKEEFLKFVIELTDFIKGE